MSPEQANLVVGGVLISMVLLFLILVALIFIVWNTGGDDE